MPPADEPLVRLHARAHFADVLLGRPPGSITQTFDNGWPVLGAFEIGSCCFTRRILGLSLPPRHEICLLHFCAFSANCMRVWPVVRPRLRFLIFHAVFIAAPPLPRCFAPPRDLPQTCTCCSRASGAWVVMSMSAEPGPGGR